jgi:hypothetical protein
VNAVESAIAAALPDIFEDSVPTAHAAPASSDIIPEGQRDATLTQVAGRLRRIGLPPETIAAALHVENRRRCVPPLSDFEVEKIARSVGRYTPSSPSMPLKGYTLAELAGHVFPERKVVFEREGTAVFRAGHLGEVYALRGIGKTWFTQTLALVAATGGSALGFSSPEPYNVAYIDGEMASREIQDRFAQLSRALEVPLTENLTVIAADWQAEFLPRLDTDAGQPAVEPFVAAADVVIIDNRSCLFDPEGEKDPVAWQPAQDWLLALRRRGKAVLLVHHSNRQGGARGHSKAEDPLNLLIKLTRPEDYSQDHGARFIVAFDKVRGAFGAAVAPFEAHLTESGWESERQDGSDTGTTQNRLCAYLRLAARARDWPKSASAAIRGAKLQKSEGLRVWGELLDAGKVVRSPAGFLLAEGR